MKPRTTRSPAAGGRRGQGRRPPGAGNASGAEKAAAAGKGRLVAKAEASAAARAVGERLQKLLSQMGLASRREAEDWIRAGRLSVNGAPAVLGVRVGPADQLRLDGRLIRQRSADKAPVFFCHRSPGEPLLPVTGAELTAKELRTSVAERLPRNAGKRFMSVSPMPAMDGGLELLSADGQIVTKLQRAVHGIEAEYSVRVFGELSEEQIAGALAGQLDSGQLLRVTELTAAGGDGANRWYKLVAIGASGKEVRQLMERQAATLSRVLRVRLGALQLQRDMPRGHWRELEDAEVQGLLGASASQANADEDAANAAAGAAASSAAADADAGDADFGQD